MTLEHTIPCETFARLSRLLKSEAHDDPWTHSIRIDDGCAVVTNRHLMVIERIPASNPEPIHVRVDPALVEACEKEAGFHSVLSIIGNTALKYASAKTTLGFQYQGNAALYLDGVNEIDRWREIVPKKLPTKSAGSMWFDTRNFQFLAETSPSGMISFPAIIDWTLPVLVRDTVDDKWCGVFYVRDNDNPHTPATIPEWLR